MLEKDAELLKNTYKDSSVLIEGHCDERGTVEYNLELGKRRAQAVKDYLVDLGIEESRIHIVSYGKERPFCTESEPGLLEAKSTRASCTPVVYFKKAALFPFILPTLKYLRDPARVPWLSRHDA